MSKRIMVTILAAALISASAYTAPQYARDAAAAENGHEKPAGEPAQDLTLD